MFSNLKELKQIIDKNYKNEEIIHDRLNFFYSDEYQNNYVQYTKDNKIESIIFKYFITDKVNINLIDQAKICFLYKVDIVDIYNDLINIIKDRNNTFSFASLILLVRKYFAFNEQYVYKDIIHMLQKRISLDNYFAKKHLPIILDQYDKSSFKSELLDFSSLYVDNYLYKSNNDIKYKKTSIYYNSIIDSSYIQANKKIIFPLSKLKGSGLASCVEYSLVMHNCLCFLGFDSFLIKSKLKINLEEEDHMLVIVKVKNNCYKLIDCAQYVVKDLTSKDIIHKRLETVNVHNDKIKYLFE